MALKPCLMMLFATAMAEKGIVRDDQKQFVAVNVYGELENVLLQEDYSLDVIDNDTEAGLVRLRSTQKRAIAIDSHAGFEKLPPSEDRPRDGDTDALMQKADAAATVVDDLSDAANQLCSASQFLDDKACGDGFVIDATKAECPSTSCQQTDCCKECRTGDDDGNPNSVDNAKCVMPFKYKYKGNIVTYDYCTAVDNQDDLWCATAVDASGHYTTWGNCVPGTCIQATKTTYTLGESNETCPTGFEITTSTMCKDAAQQLLIRFDETENDATFPTGCYMEADVAEGTTVAFFNTHPDGASLKITEKMICRTQACRTKGEQLLCVFPFIYSGLTYASCTDVANNGVTWCATAVDDHNNYDGSWGNCDNSCNQACRTMEQQSCVFPFKYNGDTHNTCTVVANDGVKWCATAVDDQDNYDGSWGNCDSPCD